MVGYPLLTPERGPLGMQDLLSDERVPVKKLVFEASSFVRTRGLLSLYGLAWSLLSLLLFEMGIN